MNNLEKVIKNAFGAISSRTPYVSLNDFKIALEKVLPNLQDTDYYKKLDVILKAKLGNFIKRNNIDTTAVYFYETFPMLLRFSLDKEALTISAISYETSQSPIIPGLNWELTKLELIIEKKHKLKDLFRDFNPFEKAFSEVITHVIDAKGLVKKTETID